MNLPTQLCILKTITRLLQNAKVMAREKQGEAAEKVMLMGKNQLKNSLLSNLSIAVALVLLSFIKGEVW